MSRQILQHILIFTFCIIFVRGDIAHEFNDNNSYAQNEILVGEQPRPSTWLKSAQDVIASPAGHVVVQVAKELLNRSTGNSQVLSLNLTNLLIIVLLKVLIFAAGMLGAGHWSTYGYGRSEARSSTEGHTLGVQADEAYLITGFLAAQGSGIDDCLYAASCNSPSVAYEYARAAKALINGIEKFADYPVDNPRYKDLIVLMEKAAYDGYRGVACNTTTRCDGLF